MTGNTLRNLVRPAPQGGVENFGVGIHVEADTVVSGNAVDNANFAGVDPWLWRGPEQRPCDGQCAERLRLWDRGLGWRLGAGGATIRDNRIARARRGAIVGMAWEKIAASDLVAEATKYPLPH